MNILIISVGLCVDFCAHIMHGFLTHPGSRSERILFIMENVAPAVVNGGCSTMLALSLLVTSRSHIFTSFFKIFLMICLFGLFHGLIMLPVILCLFGPTDTAEEEEEQKESRSNRETGGGGNPPNKIFSLKYIRTLLSEKYFNGKKNLSDKETGKEMVTLKSNVTESLLENRAEDQHHQTN